MFQINICKTSAASDLPDLDTRRENLKITITIATTAIKGGFLSKLFEFTSLQCFVTAMLYDFDKYSRQALIILITKTLWNIKYCKKFYILSLLQIGNMSA